MDTTQDMCFANLLSKPGVPNIGIFHRSINSASYSVQKRKVSHPTGPTGLLIWISFGIQEPKQHECEFICRTNISLLGVETGGCSFRL